jgi:hypothetical protein
MPPVGNCRGFRHDVTDRNSLPQLIAIACSHMIEDHSRLAGSDSGNSLIAASSLNGLTLALGMEPAAPGHDLLLGCDIGGVTVVRLIAEGGMGRVYEGKQEKPSSDPSPVSVPALMRELGNSPRGVSEGGA